MSTVAEFIREKSEVEHCSIHVESAMHTLLVVVGREMKEW